MWDFSFQKESTDNHHWRPGSLGAGYITAPTNTPDSFDLLNMDVNTWVIGPDQTQDVHREYMRSRPVTPILFQFYISPTGGIHDGGKGFKNRTGKPVKAVIEYLRRLDNRLYDGNEEIKVNRLSKVEPHFNPDTGRPCYCGMGPKTSMLKEATKYKEFMRGEVPKQIAPEEVEKFQNYINAFVEGNGFNPIPGMKKLVPWILQKVRTGELKWEGNYNKFGPSPPGGLFYDLDDREGDRQIALGGAILEELSNLFNSETSPFKLEGEECDHPAIDPATGNCEQCFDSGIKPTGTERVDLLALPINDVIDRARGHVRWVREKEKQAEIQAKIQDQEIVFGPGTEHEFSDEDKKDWYVTKMNPDAEEAKWEGIAQGNCFQSPHMPYQRAVANGELTVFVLRDPSGRGHALWGYNPDGSVRVMEDSSKMYNKPGSGWEGYDINNPWIRSMVSEANQALGLSDEYYGHEHDAPQELVEYQIQSDVDSIEELFRQYGEDAYLWEIAQEEVENDPDSVIGEDTYIHPGRIYWDRIADDFFDQIREPEFAEDLLNQITAIAANIGDFNSLVRAFDREADFYAPDVYLYEEGDGPPVYEVELWEEWKKLHTDPGTGEITAPRFIAWRERERLKADENPWAFKYPSESDIAKWHGVVPVSRDPEALRGKPVPDETLGPPDCWICEGTGKIHDGSDCQSCKGTGKQKDVQIPLTYPEWQKRRDITPKGQPVPAPAGRVREDAAGQLFFAKKQSGLHFNSRTGEPCYCGFGQMQSGMQKEANLKYREFMRGQNPKGMSDKDADSLRKVIEKLIEGDGMMTPATPGIKKVVPWIIEQIKKGGMELRYTKSTGVPYLVIDRNGGKQHFDSSDLVPMISNLFNSEDTPVKRNEDDTKIDLMRLGVEDIIQLSYDHAQWLKEKEDEAIIKEQVKNQKVVYKFSGDKEGWFVTQMNPDGDEARAEGIAQGNCFQSENQPYQYDVDNGTLTVYVLRDPEGRGHALWGYNPDGSVRVMEDSSKMYNKPGSGWEGYQVNNYWIRQMISEANQSIEWTNKKGEKVKGRDDEYYDGMENPPILEAVQLDDIETLNEFFDRYGPDGSLWNAAVAKVGDPDRIDETTRIIPGSVNWNKLAQDFFTVGEDLFGVRSPEQSEYILNEIIKLMRSSNNPQLEGSFYAFIDAFDKTAKELEKSDPKSVASQMKVWKKWSELHKDPSLGEQDADEMLVNTVRDPRRLNRDEIIEREQAQKTNPWAFQFPPEEDLPSIMTEQGIVPASIDPNLKRGEFPLTVCQTCNGTGYPKEYFDMAGYYNQSGGRECKDCHGLGRWRKQTPAPGGGEIREDSSGQLFFAKKKLWDMTPLSFADELKLHVASIEPKHSHSLSWVKGGKGRGLMLNDGTLVTWPVNKKGEPQHPDMYEYLTGTKLPPAFLPEHFTEGTPFDIYEDGTLAFFSDDVPADLISDLSKIDYRLKVSKVAKKEFTKEDVIELLEKNNWDFDANEFFMGMNDELEHTDVTHGDPEITAKIVADHLKEHPDYYSRLHKTFKKSKVNHKFDFHFNPFTGEPCTCGYNYVFHANHKQASQSVRKIKNQKQKFLQGDQGQAILDYLHRLISGFGINEQGDFGHGDFPGLEGMVPWIIKQIKTGYIRPSFDENGACTRLDSFYGSEDYAKRELAEKLQARPLLVVGNDEPVDDLIEGGKEEGWPIVSDPKTPDIRFAWCNDDTMSPRNLETLAAALPEDATIYLTLDTVTSIAQFLENNPEYEEFKEERNAGYAPFINFTDQIPRDIKTPTDFGGSERHAFGRGQSLCKNTSPDLSKVSMSQLSDRHFTGIHFDDWANWFNANNAPARRGRTKDQIRGALNRATKQIEYRNQRNPEANYDTELVGSNALLIALLAEELKVDSGDLTRIILNFESDGLNKIVDELDKYYTANIDEMGVERVNALSNQHRKYLQELREIENLKEMFEEISEDSVVYRVQDPAFKGWTVNRIRDREEAEMESQVLGHCIGDDGQNYVYAIDDGRIEAFSLRDPHGIPKLTWHYNPDGTLAHIQGKSSDSYQLFRHIVTEFNSEEGRDDAGGGPGSEDDLNPGETYWQLNDPTTMEEWIEQKDDPWTIAQDEAERAGERLAEECEIDAGSAQWYEIVEDFIESDDYDQCMTFLKYLTMYGGEYDMRRFAEAMRDNLAEHDAFYAEAIEEDPHSKYKDTIDLFNSWALANTNPETGQLRSPRQLYHEEAYDRIREEVRQAMGDDAANAMLPYESLPNVLGISQGGGGYFGGKYLPAMLDPRLQKTDLAPEACTSCKGSGYVYAPVRVRSSTDETRYELIKCDRCQGTGKFTDVPAEPDIASMPVQGNPMEYMEMEAPEIPQPETQRRTMWCHFCTGRGGGRVMVPDEDGEGSHPEWKPCEKCNGTGQLQFTYEASLSPKEKAEAWDKPRIKLTAAQQAYVDGLLIKSDTWQF